MCPASLEVGQPSQHDREAQVDVGRSRVDAELDAERATELELPLEPAVGQDGDGVAG